MAAGAPTAEQLEEILGRKQAALKRAARMVLAAEPQPDVTAKAAAALFVEDSAAGDPHACWTEYLVSRGWVTAFAAADAHAQLAALLHLSAQLAFPIAVARSWQALVVPGSPEPADGRRLCVVGARAEVALPVEVWAELLLVVPARRLTIEFRGPAACPPDVPPVRTWRSGDGGKELRLLLGTSPMLRDDIAALYHHSDEGVELLAAAGRAGPLPAALQQKLPDAFVLFNPGFGSPAWTAAWAPTVRCLLTSQRPILTTALSAHDAARDESVLDSELASLLASRAAQSPEQRRATAPPLPPYEANPFTSLLSTTGEPLSRALAELASAKSEAKSALHSAVNMRSRVVPPLVR